MHGSASAARKTRAPWFLALVVSLFAALGVLAFAAARADAVPLAGSPNPLPGSSFEGGDGNQAAGTVLRTDWQNVSPVNHTAFAAGSGSNPTGVVSTANDGKYLKR